jgi:hypothetical protein
MSIGSLRPGQGIELEIRSSIPSECCKVSATVVGLEEHPQHGLSYVVKARFRTHNPLKPDSVGWSTLTFCGVTRVDGKWGTGALWPRQEKVSQ